MSYSEVFEVADYESEVKISKLKMADKFTNFMSFYRSDCVIWKNLVLRSIY